MKFLECLLCSGELEIISNEAAPNKEVKCNYCGYSSRYNKDHEPEIIIRRKR